MSPRTLGDLTTAELVESAHAEVQGLLDLARAITDDPLRRWVPPVNGGEPIDLLTCYATSIGARLGIAADHLNQNGDNS